MSWMFRQIDEHYFSAQDAHALHPGRPFFVLSVRDEDTFEAVEQTGSSGAEDFAALVLDGRAQPGDIHDLREEARKIIEWLNLFLLHSGEDGA